MSKQIGTVTWISGPVIRAQGSRAVSMLELVEVGDQHLVGEVIGLEGDTSTIQVYEETSGMQPGSPVFGTGLPLSVELGPGLLTSIFEGVQRPLPVIEMRSGTYIGRGVHLTPLYRKERWDFTAVLKEGDEVSAGAIIGTVPETPALEHRIMVPPDVSGTLTWVAENHQYTLDEPIARVRMANGEERELTMLQRWPVRQLRPYRARLGQHIPLITGQRVLDTFFPLAKGGAAAIPGGFGSGKTVTQHSIAKWADAQVIVYIGCGERGNE
ncbi:MAG: V-type ATP synthase subunit A, partial [Chloroflexi bacterium]